MSIIEVQEFDTEEDAAVANARDAEECFLISWSLDMFSELNEVEIKRRDLGSPVLICTSAVCRSKTACI